MINNFKAVSSVNQSKIHFKDNGNQFSQNTNIEDVQFIYESITNELKYLDYTINQLEAELSNYNMHITGKLERIESLQLIIDNGIKVNTPIYKRGLSTQHLDLEFKTKELMSLYDQRNGINFMLTKLKETKFKYHTILRECKAVIKY